MMTTDVEEMRDDGYGRQGDKAVISEDKHGGENVGQQRKRKLKYGKSKRLVR